MTCLSLVYLGLCVLHTARHTAIINSGSPVAASLAVSLHTHTYTQSANQRSEKGHLCLPGLPGDEEEAVIGGIDPVGASLADHYAAAGVSAAAVAAVMLQNKGRIL